MLNQKGGEWEWGVGRGEWGRGRGGWGGGGGGGGVGSGEWGVGNGGGGVGSGEWGMGSGEWGMGSGVKEITFSSLFPIPHSPLPLLLKIFLKRLAGVQRLWRRWILTVKFRKDNQQTKFRVKDGTEVHCFKPVRV